MSEIDKLKEQLVSGVAKFSYMTSKNDERVAYGTLKPDLIPTYSTEQVQALIDASLLLKKSFEGLRKDWMEEWDIKETDYDSTLLIVEKAFKPFEPKDDKIARAPKPEHLQTYYDFGSKGFRSFNINNLINVG